jgi:hypothetical protein
MDQDEKFLQDRFEYLKSEYRPHPIHCVEAEFKCDFHVDESNKCPCEWALNDEQRKKFKGGYFKGREDYIYAKEDED